MLAKINNQFFKKSLILFWAAWWIIALWTDVIGGFAHLGWVKGTWAPDTNMPYLIETLKMYHATVGVSVFFFICILCWSTLSSIAFCWASAAIGKNESIWMSRARIAYIVSLGFWLAFFLADQLVMKFDLEQNHMVQGGFELLSFLSMYLLPKP